MPALSACITMQWSGIAGERIQAHLAKALGRASCPGRRWPGGRPPSWQRRPVVPYRLCWSMERAVTSWQGKAWGPNAKDLSSGEALPRCRSASSAPVPPAAPDPGARSRSLSTRNSVRRFCWWAASRSSSWPSWHLGVADPQLDSPRPFGTMRSGGCLSSRGSSPRARFWLRSGYRRPNHGSRCAAQLDDDGRVVHHGLIERLQGSPCRSG